MAKTSYLRFNPDTREIELEGSEEFIKAYFDKLQQRLPQSAGKGRNEPAAAKALPVKEAGARKKAKKEIPVAGKVAKPSRKKAAAKGSKEVPLINKIVGLIQDSAKGITTAELKAKTGLTNKQIWAITSRAARIGKIKKTKRGIYMPG